MQPRPATGMSSQHCPLSSLLVHLGKPGKTVQDPEGPPDTHMGDQGELLVPGWSLVQPRTLWPLCRVS